MNHDELLAVYAETSRLQDEGKLTQAEFDRLLALAKRIVGPDTHALEGLILVRDLAGLV